MNTKQIIENKKSVRDFSDKKIASQTLLELNKYAQEMDSLLPESFMDIAIMKNSEVFPNLDQYAGYHGNMISAPNYIVICTKKADHGFTNAGYIGEKLSIFAYSLGIDSCFITFPDGAITAKKLGIIEDKEVAAILAIGYGKNTASKKVTNNTGVGGNYSQADVHVSSGQKEEKISPEQMVYIDIWGNRTTTEDLQNRGILDALLYASLAPSSYNRQPWRFIIDKEKIILTVEKSSFQYPYEEKIDAGISMLYFEIGIKDLIPNFQWHFSPIENTYQVPSEYDIISYGTL